MQVSFQRKMEASVFSNTKKFGNIQDSTILTRTFSVM